MPSAFMKVFHREVEALIASHGAKVEGSGADGGSELFEFQLDYRWERNQGIVRIHTVSEPSGMKVRVFCYEHSR